MKIVFLSRYQNSTQRGAENFVTELAKRLSRENEVEILAGDDADSLGKIIKGNYDWVIPINGRTQSLKASLGRIIKGYKILISGHSGIGKDDIWNIVVARPNVFVCLTNLMFKWAKRWASGIKLSMIPDGVDMNKFNPKGAKIDIGLKKPVILSVGALSWYKHHEKVIKAVAEIDGVSLLIIGKGEERDNLYNLGKVKLGDRFKIMDFSYDEMPKVYRSCDLFTLPSWDREAFGIVYLEAMASGLGIVAPNDESRSEIVGDAGELVDVNDADAYAKTLSSVLSKEWTEKAIKQAEKFSWDKVATSYEKLMKEL